MPDKVNLVRPDGSIIQVSPEDAATLRGVGYSDEPEHLRFQRNQQAGQEEYYTRPGQQVKTVGEGLLSGLSFGATDAGFDALGFDTSSRAKYNPGKRLASEVVGAILPSIILPGSGEAAVAERGLASAFLARTPAGLVSRGAEALAPVLAESRVGQGIVRGAIEGSVQGGGAEVTNAVLSGDPLTAESVIAGMGWGGLLGGALGGMFSKADDVATAYAAKRAESKLAPEVIAAEHYSPFQAAISDARKVAGEAATTAEAEVNRLASAVPLDDLRATLAARDEAAGKLINQATAEGKIGGTLFSEARVAKNEAISAMKRATRHINAGELEKAEAAIAEHSDAVARLSQATGLEMPVLPQVAKQSTSALEEVKNLKAVQKSLDRFPVTSAGFTAISPGKMEKHLAAIDTLMKTGGAELEGVRSGLSDSISKMADGLGVKVTGGPAEQLRAVWETARKVQKGASSPGMFQRAMTSMAGGVLKQGLGTSIPGVSHILALKSAVLGKISDAVAKWAPRATKAAVKVNAGARIDPLRRRLDGSIDEGKRSRRELMKARAEEIRRVAPMVSDLVYKAVAPVAGAHPEFAAQTMKTAVQQFSTLTEHLPRDPGTAISRMESLWAPDMIATERFARIYEVFHDPVGVAQRALEGGDLSPEAAAALREFAPQVFSTLRVGMIEKISEPGVLEKMDYRDQVRTGQLLDLTLTSTTTPRFIAAQQQMYAERNPKQPVTPGTSASTNPSGGRPPGASAAQTITEH